MPEAPTTDVPDIPGVELTRVPDLRPRGDRILVVRHKVEKSKGGIIIPDTAQEKSKKGTVLRVGPGRLLGTGERHEIDLHAGDVVLVLAYAGADITIDGIEFVLIEDGDIIATLGPDELTR